MQRFALFTFHGEPSGEALPTFAGFFDEAPDALRYAYDHRATLDSFKIVDIDVVREVRSGTRTDLDRMATPLVAHSGEWGSPALNMKMRAVFTLGHMPVSQNGIGG